MVLTLFLVNGSTNDVQRCLAVFEPIAEKYGLHGVRVVNSTAQVATLDNMNDKTVVVSMKIGVDWFGPRDEVISAIKRNLPKAIDHDFSFVD